MVINHHAYVVTGGPELLPAISNFIDQATDIHWLTVADWGIDDSRQLRERQELYPAVADRQFFVLQINSISIEAQNALLKILEEPAGYSHFFLIIPPGLILLPTLLSRCQVWVPESSMTVSPDLVLAQQFLAATPVQRLALVDKLEAVSFINQLERVAVTRSDQSWTNLLTAARYAHDPAAMPRLLLEHLALTLPSVVV